MLYFAYGSNMSPHRIRDRVSNADFVGVAVLQNFQLRFHKKGLDGSAKADALYTGKVNDQIYGALYRLDGSDFSVLDRIESCGVGYERKEVKVNSVGGDVRAWVYCALHIDRSLVPYHWYHQHVLEGAMQLGLPEGYIEHIKSFAVKVDKNEARTRKELAVYQMINN
ncbi:MAG: gamma-glutamylcyclotransferase family protein [Neptuniibacter sp.]